MGPARFCLMISWLWNQIKDGGSSGWCRRYSGLSLGSIALLVWSSATGDAKLKVTESAPTDGFAGEEVASIEVDHYLLLMPQPAACSCLFFFEFGCTLINYHVGFLGLFLPFIFIWRGIPSSRFWIKVSITRISQESWKVHKALRFNNSMNKCGFLLDFRVFHELTKGWEKESLLCIVCLNFHFNWSLLKLATLK